jgi:hypothetical protein
VEGQAPINLHTGNMIDVLSSHGFMVALRPVIRCVAVLSIATAVIGSTRETPVLLAAETPRLVLNLHFTSSDALSITSRGALVKEAESIWKTGPVRLRWLRESTEAADGPTLRVLVVARPAPRTAEYSPWTVAELQRLEDSRAIAIASTIGARRIVDEGRRELLTEPAALHDHRLGVVLGRAVSHEIGHYLLDTNTHARQGLMRARIDAREFADLRSGSFRLDHLAEAHLAMLATRGTLSPETLTGFSYPAR